MQLTFLFQFLSCTDSYYDIDSYVINNKKIFHQNEKFKIQSSFSTMFQFCSNYVAKFVL